MGHVKMKHKENQPTNGTEQQPSKELNPSGPIIETCQKVLSLHISIKVASLLSDHYHGGHRSSPPNYMTMTCL